MTAPDRETDAAAREAVDAAMAVHRTPGPGLLEGVCEQRLAHELEHRGIGVRSCSNVPVPEHGIRRVVRS